MLICDHKNGKFFSEEFSYHENEMNQKKRREYIEKRMNEGNMNE
jgi:hypothetical protein